MRKTLKYEIKRFGVYSIQLLVFLLILATLGESVLAEINSSSKAGEWQRLEPGLDWGVFVGSQSSTLGDSKIRILRIDPEFFDFHLINASAQADGKNLSAKDWARKHHLTATINASMYQANLKTSVSLMRTGEHVNSNWLSKDRSVFAFDPVGDSLPKAQIIDRDCQNLGALREQYGTLIQSIRMVSCKGKNVWKPQDKVWSATAIGTDKQGRTLFIHVQTPFSMYDFINMLLELPIDLERAMYTEGGPQAQLYVNSSGRDMEWLGKYVIGGGGVGENQFGWPIPNVVGITPIKKTTQ
ncbi:MAG: phosphodiester glycosidase family protein [Candidatus Nitrohelix vancouverensis]|uniref:Phosphodiester glycosidase family protein n=1 Tax=Candidatus Nitrohelix vancouverensis TaxID=2705534 RepID=A0A7T0C0E1_9BACT|nr:MAG: phosphodiester glycosidase family protein [Candidatus Nitrohelix vancouverensis]